MYHAVAEISKGLLRQGLEDDGWQWDWTTRGALGPGGAAKPIRAQLIAKAPGVWAADPVVQAMRWLSAELDQEIRVELCCADGHRLRAGERVASWQGPAAMVLALERPFLNLASYLCGIATATDRLVAAAVAAVRGAGSFAKPPRITATRKTLPGYRDLAVHAVCVGGGHSHRISLAGGILIKENHIAAAGGIAAAMAGVRSVAPHLLKVEIEVRSVAEVQEALAAGADGLLLDNFSPDQVEQALQLIRKRGAPVFVEVSGGIHEGNIGQYVLSGVHVISSGALTHSVRALDLSLLVDGVGVGAGDGSVDGSVGQ